MMTQNIIDVYEKLQDEESKKLFDMRLSYAINKNDGAFIDELMGMNKVWTITDRDNLDQFYCGQKIVIYGAGAYGRATKKILEQAGYSIYAFGDRIARGEIEGINIKSIDELISDKEDYFYVLASVRYWKEMYEHLGGVYGFRRESIFVPRTGSIIATCGVQYFDCPECNLEDEEFFLDLGMCEGETVEEVINRCQYKNIIGVEANCHAYKDAKAKLGSIPNIELYQCAAWLKDDKISFDIDGTASRIGGGQEYIIARSVDSILDGRKATFIKMDIEGAEEMALMGAKLTIQRHHPKLAICVYHKPEDFYKIPKMILDYDSSYRFYLRHYNSNMWETVLYAV